MKALTLIISLTLFPIVTHPECECTSSGCIAIKALKAIELKLKRNASPKAVQPKVLAPVIIRLSKQYDVNPDTIVRIILIESKGIASAYNKRTNDYGLMQINGRTAKAYGLSKACLRNWECNLEAGIRVLADIRDGRVCRYNVGSGRLHKAKLSRCITYERKLASIN